MKLPLPPGTLPTLWGDDDRYVASYLSAFPGYYLTGDGGYFDEDGYLFVMGRTDDVINVAGHRMSTGSIEAVLAAHPAVAECAVIGVADELKGQVPRGFVVLKAGASADGLADELVAAVRENIGAVACFQGGRRRARVAEDPVGQDPAQDDARHRRRPRRAGAVDHRGPGGTRDADADPAKLTYGDSRSGTALQPRSPPIRLPGNEFSGGVWAPRPFLVRLHLGRRVQQRLHDSPRLLHPVFAGELGGIPRSSRR